MSSGDQHVLQGELSFPEALDFLYRQNFTGKVILHYFNGLPRIIEYGIPNRINLTLAPQQKVLDNSRPTTDTSNRIGVPE